MTPHLKSIRFSNWFIFGFFLIFFLALYASTLTTDYGFLDDYVLIARGRGSPPIKRKIKEGRPLYALSTHLYMMKEDRDVEDLRHVRFMGILGVALVAWSTFRLFVRSGWTWFPSICVSVLICTTLPFQVWVAWATTWAFPFSAVASGIALLLSDRAYQTQRRRLKWLLTAGATLILLSAVLIYQPAAMFFWSFAAVVLLKPDTPLHDMLRRFGWYGMIALVGMLLGFMIYQLSSGLYPEVHQRTGLVQAPFVKAAWFLIEAFPNALLFAFLSPARWLLSGGTAPLSAFYRIVDIGIAWTFFLIIVRGLFVYFQGARKERLWKCSIAAILLILSYTPNLVAAENWATYRSLSSLTSVVVVLMCLALRGYIRHLDFRLSPICIRLVVGCLATFSAVSAAYHVRTYFVVPQSRELAIMRGELMKKPLSQVHNISVIASRKGDTLAPLQRYEFGLPSSSDTVTARDMTVLLMRKGKAKEVDPPITAVAADAPLKPRPADLVVDMRMLRVLSSPPNNRSSTYWETYRRYLNPFRGRATFRAP